MSNEANGTENVATESDEVEVTEEDYAVADDVMLLHRYMSAFSEHGLQDVNVDAVSHVTHIVSDGQGRSHKEAVSLGSGFMMGWSISRQMQRDGVDLKSMEEIILDVNAPCPCRKDDCGNSPEWNAEVRETIARGRASARTENTEVDTLMHQMMEAMSPEMRAIAEKIGPDRVKVAILKGSQVAEIFKNASSEPGTGGYL